MSRAKKRVIVFQKTLHHYRLGVFERIAQSDEFDYTFCFGGGEPSPGANGPEADTRFRARFTPIRSWRPPGARGSLLFQPAELRAAMGREFDVLIFWADLHIVSFVLASVIARLRGRKVVHWGHGVSRGGPRNPLVRWFRRQVMKPAHAVLLYGPRELEAYRRLGVDTRNVFMAFNALDTRTARRWRAALTDADLDRFRRERGLDGRRVLLFTGRLAPRKRVVELVRAVAIIRRAVPEVRLVIIGDGPERGRVRREIERLDLADAVTMPGAIYDEETLAKYFRCSELAVCAGGMGLAINHAFVYGVPVLTTDDLWTHGPEIALVEPGKTGELFADGDLDSLADRAIGLLNDADRLAAMSRQCMKVIDEQFNETVMAKQFDKAVRYALDH